VYDKLKDKNIASVIQLIPVIIQS